MQLGTYEIPETRLFPTCINDLKKIYEQAHADPISSNDVAKALGFAAVTSGGFYRKLNSLVTYGLLDQVGRGTFKVSQLGTDSIFPADADHKKEYKQAVMNVALWAELYKKFKKNLPENIFVSLKNLTGAEPQQVQNAEKDVRKWYLDDIMLIPDEFLNEEKSYMAQESSKKQEANSTIADQVQNLKEDLLTIPFGNKYVVQLPANESLSRAWSRLKKYMDLYVEEEMEADNTSESAEAAEYLSAGDKP